MEQRRFNQRPMQRPVRRKPTDESGCTIEIKKTKSGKKIKIGRGCSKEELQMLKETGQINFDGE